MTDRLGVSLHAVSVRRGREWALKDITLELAPGERWALIGENGSGKTQLLKLLAGDVWPTPTGREARVYRVGRRETDLIEAKSRIAYLGGELQDKYARYGWDLPVRDLVATGLHRTDLLLRPVSAAERRRVDATLSSCGLTRLAERRFSTLSYGQKRLALLARALGQAPDWLLLDELYNGLDAGYRARIDRVLERARARGCSWIVAAHRAADVPAGTRGILELAAGRLHSVRVLRRAELARLERAARERPGRVSPARASPRRVSPGRVSPGRGKGEPVAPARRRSRRAPWLTLRRVSLYVDYRRVLRDLCWDVFEGEHWAIFGANGAGKTSLLKLLYGDLAPALGGRIERRGVRRGTPIAAWKRLIGYVSPELQTDYAVNVTLRDLVASGRHASIGLVDAPSAEDRRAADRWLRFFKLASVAGRRPRELSYGQLRRALIARALAGRARMLLLDEPLTGLDPRQRALMKRLLERLMRDRVTVIIAGHHPEDLPRGMTHGLRLHRGRAHFTDSYSAT
jgi:molybdate transport system ATP-binding protein